MINEIHSRMIKNCRNWRTLCLVYFSHSKSENNYSWHWCFTVKITVPFINMLWRGYLPYFIIFLQNYKTCQHLTVLLHSGYSYLCPVALGVIIIKSGFSGNVKFGNNRRKKYLLSICYIPWPIVDIISLKNSRQRYRSFWTFH